MSELKYDLDQPLEKLIEIATKKFGELDFEKVVVGDAELEVLQIKDMPAYIDKLVGQASGKKTVDLPLWAKVWPSCLFLGFYLQQFPFKEGDHVLEIGAGVAVIGLIVAKKGFQVTLTDIEDDALLFARINVLKNGVQDNVDIKKVDFTKDNLGQEYDHIIGCEVLYSEPTYVPVAQFLNNHLSHDKGAEIVMAMDKKRVALRFFEEAQKNFMLMHKGFTFKDKESEEEQEINLFRMRRNQHD